MFTDNSLQSVKNYFFDKLKEHHSEREIQLFFEFTCQDKFELTRAELITGDKRFSESELLIFREVVKQLQDQVPIQYILGKSHFMGLDFKIGPGVLCPRPETEELVDLIVKEQQKGTLLDIGTGSGVIPLAVKKNRPNIEVTGLDKSPIAMEYAKENAKAHKLEAKWIQLDILNQHLNTTFDIVVSNPPYVLESDKKDMQRNVLAYEPKEALFVPDDEPLLFYNRIAEMCTYILVPGGSLYFEIHEKLGSLIKSMLEENAFVDVQLIKDMQGKDRIIKAKKAPSL